MAPPYMSIAKRREKRAIKMADFEELRETAEAIRAPAARGFASNWAASSRLRFEKKHNLRKIASLGQSSLLRLNKFHGNLRETFDSFGKVRHRKRRHSKSGDLQKVGGKIGRFYLGL